ncbi:MAG: DUF3617 family protein [Sphingomicrobium sp.]
MAGMIRGRYLTGAIVAAAAVALGAADQPEALGAVKPGLWELTGLPGTTAASRVCIHDVAALSRFEHRASHCSSKALSDDGRSTVVEYSCGAAGFGRTQIDVITPRSLKIATQGIADSLPFNYTLQAHRVGDCDAASPVH